MSSSTPDLMGKPSPTASLAAHRVDIAPELPPPENKAFYPALDGLRAVAVLMVFGTHYLSQFKILRWGWIGVDMFFVLSGFLITGILYDSRAAKNKYKNFYARRTLRIFPLYYGVLVLLLLLTPFLRFAWSPIWITWPLYLGNYSLLLGKWWIHGGQVGQWLMIRNPIWGPRLGMFVSLGHFWSLCIEEQFYLVWPIIVFSVRDRIRLRNLCIAVIVTWPFLRSLAELTFPRVVLGANILYRGTPFRVDAFLIGGLLALMLRGPEITMVKRYASALLLVSGGILATCIFVAYRFYDLPDPPSTNNAWIVTFGFTIIDLFSAGIIALTIQPGTVFYKLMYFGPLRRLGQVSYGFYVLHDVFHPALIVFGTRLAGRMGHHTVVVTVSFAFLCTWVAAWLSFKFFETPFLRLKSKFVN